MADENRSGPRKLLIRRMFKVCFNILQFMLMLVQFVNALSGTKLFEYLVEAVKIIVKFIFKK